MSAHDPFFLQPSAPSGEWAYVSAIVLIEDRSDPFTDLAGLEHITAHAFGQRRKMLRASLRGLGDAEALLALAGIDPTARPETVPPEGFFTLVRAWRATN